MIILQVFMLKHAQHILKAHEKKNPAEYKPNLSSIRKGGGCFWILVVMFLCIGNESWDSGHRFRKMKKIVRVPYDPEKKKRRIPLELKVPGGWICK